VELLLTMLLLAAVVAVLAAPFRRHDGRGAAAGHDDAELEAVRHVKLREILDTELDYRTGKLSERDYRELDTALRAEAIALLGRNGASKDADGTP
jgi:hypothetical protein